MKAQTSAALCINTLLVLNAGPGPAKLQPAPARCRSPPSTGQDQTDTDGLTPGTNRCCRHLTGCRVAVAFGALQPVGFWMVLEGERKLPRAPGGCRATFCHPRSPRAPRELVWKAPSQPASPVGSQFSSLQHSNHSAPLGAGFLLQSDHDDIPSSPGRETRRLYLYPAVGTAASQGKPTSGVHPLPQPLP